MRLLLAGIIVLGSAVAHQPSASACGLKLTVAAAKVNKPVAPSRNPSRVLILGDAPSTVARALKRAGHVVETADTVDEVKTRKYQVVLVSNDSQLNTAKDQWNDSKVLAMKRGASPNVELVENSLGAKPIDSGRGDDRTVVRAGPDDDPDHKKVASGEGTDEDRTKIDEGKGESKLGKLAPSEQPTQAAVDEKPAVEEKPAEKTKPVEEKPVVAEKPVEKTKPVVEEKPVVAEKTKPVEKTKPIVEEEEEEAPVASRTAPLREEPVAKEKPAKRGKKGAESVRFELGASALGAAAKAQLDRHVAYMKANSSVTLLIEGHTDEIGPEEMNLVLSEARADRAMKYMIRRGIAESRITTQAFGELNPPYPPGSNTKNRCAFFKFSGE